MFPMSFLPAPSAAPTSVSVSEVTSTSITVQWGAVDCIHRNGDITGYSVRYGVQGSGSTQTVSVSGGGATMTTISGLMASTTFSIDVAAVNSAGTGMHSAVWGTGEWEYTDCECVRSWHNGLSTVLKWQQ